MRARHITKFTDAAQRGKQKIPLAEVRRILARLADLQRALDDGDTSALDVKAMSGHPDRFRLRVGDYRVVYTTKADDTGRLIVWVWVLAAAHRREVYRRQ